VSQTFAINQALQIDATGIQIGIRGVNSYNKQTSFRLEMFGFRRVCQNGMSFGAKSFGVVENTIHYGSKEKNLQAISRITEGFIKLYCKADSAIVIGGVVVAPKASELIFPIAMAVENRLTADQIAHTFTIYPSLTGSIAEAARRLRQDV
jgi:hypothetical protein